MVGAVAEEKNGGENGEVVRMERKSSEMEEERRTSVHWMTVATLKCDTRTRSGTLWTSPPRINQNGLPLSLSVSPLDHRP